MKSKLLSIFLIIILINTSVFAITQSDINEAKDKQNEAEEHLDEVQEQLSEQLEAIVELDVSIKEHEDDIRDLNYKIEKLENNIEKKNKEIDKLKKEYEEKEELLKQRLVALYEMGQTTYLDVLLSSSSLTDLVSNYYMVSQLAEADNQVLDSIESSKKAVERAKKELEEEKQKVASAKADVQSQKLQLQNKKMQRQAKVDDLSKEEKELETEIKEYQEAIDKMEDELARAMSNSNYHGTYSGGKLEWPIPGEYYVTSYVGMRWGRMHKGIDIGASTGTPVIAAEDGEVVICTYDSGGYGYYIAINHGNGYMTLYGHLSQQLVSVGQTVRRGERIALSGNTGASTGPHLHFELRYLNSGTANASNYFYNAEVLNPLNYV